MKRVFHLFLIGVFFLTGSSCYTGRNIAGRRTIQLMPDSFLSAQAFQAYNAEKRKNRVSHNLRNQAIVKRVAQRIIAVAERDYPQTVAGFHWEVNLFDKPNVVNAYAMPGGKIAVYTGILPVCRNEAGVAAVMGHEVSHAMLRHGNERITQQLGIQGVLLGAAIGIGRSKMNSDTKRIIMAGLGLGSTVGLILPFSRKQESEADKVGVILMAKAGYDPSVAPQIWIRMGNMSKGKQPPEFMSTHPSHERRIADLTALQPDAMEYYERAATKYGNGETLSLQ